MGNRVRCGPSGPAGHSLPPASQQQRPGKAFVAFLLPTPWAAAPISHRDISGLARLLPRMGSWGTQADSAACRAPGGRACQGPFSLSPPPPAPLVQRRCLGYELGRSFVGRQKANFSCRNSKHCLFFILKDLP